MNKYYNVEIGGNVPPKRLEDFMNAVEELASQYGDIEVKTVGEFYKEK